MVCLTKQERRVLGIVVLLLLTGWITKMHRAPGLPVPKPATDSAPTTVVTQPSRP